MRKRKVSIPPPVVKQPQVEINGKQFNGSVSLDSFPGTDKFMMIVRFQELTARPASRYDRYETQLIEFHAQLELETLVKHWLTLHHPQSPSA